MFQTKLVSAYAMRFCKLGLLLMIAATPACFASVHQFSPVPAGKSSLTMREGQVWNSVLHHSPLAALRHSRPETRCEATQPPEPLATPDPLLRAAGVAIRVKVSFIIGMDGQVQSPVILESAGPVEDRSVLETLRLWRYRPASCNSAPAETEARVEFSSR